MDIVDHAHRLDLERRAETRLARPKPCLRDPSGDGGARARGDLAHEGDLLIGPGAGHCRVDEDVGHGPPVLDYGHV